MNKAVHEYGPFHQKGLHRILASETVGSRFYPSAKWYYNPGTENITTLELSSYNLDLENHSRMTFEEMFESINGFENILRGVSLNSWYTNGHNRTQLTIFWRCSIFHEPGKDEWVYTPTVLDNWKRHSWSLKIYPKGYDLLRNSFLSVNLKAKRNADWKEEQIRVGFEVFIVNLLEKTKTVRHKSALTFEEISDHWGFNRVILL